MVQLVSNIDRQIDNAQVNALTSLVKLTGFDNYKAKVPPHLSDKIFEEHKVSSAKPSKVSRWTSPFENFKGKEAFRKTFTSSSP